jgi:hypothetical protein
MTTTYTQKHNAKAAACKMIAQGKTPGGALDFEIVPDGDRFAIVWGYVLAGELISYGTSLLYAYR